jgi:hypothetical protein
MREKLCPFGANVVKIIVTHHPFDLPEGFDDSELVGRAQMAMETLADCGADVFFPDICTLAIPDTQQNATKSGIIQRW